MVCKNPYVQGLLPFGCGQCMPCRINRRRLWTHRILLESMKHSASSFVTLTYDEANLPAGNTLVKKHYQKFLKDLRAAIYPAKIRYFFVGEYGDATQRPHYHAAIFGLGEEDKLVIEKAWSRGYSYVGSLTKDSAQYIAGYVCKKMTNGKNERVKEWLAGRHPEFARMSLKPGIGALAVDELGNLLTSKEGIYAVEYSGDVPSSLAHGVRSLPLGRYLKQKLRERISTGDVIKKEQVQKFAEEMRQLSQEIASDETLKNKTWRDKLLAKNKQKVLNLEVRTKIFSSKKGTI